MDYRLILAIQITIVFILITRSHGRYSGYNDAHEDDGINYPRYRPRSVYENIGKRIIPLIVRKSDPAEDLDLNYPRYRSWEIYENQPQTPPVSPPLPPSKSFGYFIDDDYEFWFTV
jgi:hypothetical protein